MSMIVVLMIVVESSAALKSGRVFLYMLQIPQQIQHGKMSAAPIYPHLTVLLLSLYFMFLHLCSEWNIVSLQ